MRTGKVNEWELRRMANDERRLNMEALFSCPSEKQMRLKKEYLPNGIRLVFMKGTQEAAYTRTFRNEMWYRIGLELLAERLSGASVVPFPWRESAPELPCWEISPPEEKTSMQFISLNGKPILSVKKPDSPGEAIKILHFLQSESCKQQIIRIRNV